MDFPRAQGRCKRPRPRDMCVVRCYSICRKRESVSDMRSRGTDVVAAVARCAVHLEHLEHLDLEHFGATIDEREPSEERREACPCPCFRRTRCFVFAVFSPLPLRRTLSRGALRSEIGQPSRPRTRNLRHLHFALRSASSLRLRDRTSDPRKALGCRQRRREI